MYCFFENKLDAFMVSISNTSQKKHFISVFFPSLFFLISEDKISLNSLSRIIFGHP